MFSADNQQLLFKHIDTNYLSLLELLITDLNAASRANPQDRNIISDIDRLKELQRDIRAIATVKNNDFFIKTYANVERLLNQYTTIFESMTGDLKSQRAIILLEKHQQATIASLRQQIADAFLTFEEAKLRDKPEAPAAARPKISETRQASDAMPQFEALYRAILDFVNKQLPATKNQDNINDLQRIKTLANDALKNEMESIGKTIDPDVSKDYIEEMLGILKKESLEPQKATDQYRIYSNILTGLENAFNSIRAYKVNLFARDAYTTAQPLSDPKSLLETILQDLMYDLRRLIEESTENKDPLVKFFNELHQKVQDIFINTHNNASPDWKKFQNDIDEIHTRAKSSTQTFGIFGKPLPNIPIFMRTLSIAESQLKTLKVPRPDERK